MLFAGTTWHRLVPCISASKAVVRSRAMRPHKDDEVRKRSQAWIWLVDSRSAGG